MTTYAVLLHVNDKKLPIVLEVLRDNATLVSITPTSPDEKPKRTANMAYANGKRFKGISGEDLTVKILTDFGGRATIKQIEEGFVANGFAASSASPALGQAVAAKKVRYIARGDYCLPGHTVHIGAG